MSVSIIATIWANQILEGKKTFDQVPRLLKDEVKQILIDFGREDLILDDRNNTSN